MFLKGENIFIRALEPSDAALLYTWENDPELWPVSFSQVPFSRFMLEEYVNSAHQDIYTNKQLRLIVCLNNSKPAGVVDLFEFEPRHDRSGLGIYINNKERGKGLAFECVELIKSYSFSVLHLKQLYVHVNSSNTASLALFDKAGFIRCGLKKAWNKTGLNSYEDVWFMQCINADA